jgi:hypothetical protein
VLIAPADQIRVASSDQQPIDSAALTRDGIDLEAGLSGSMDRSTTESLDGDRIANNSTAELDSFDLTELDFQEQPSQQGVSVTEDAGQVVPPVFEGNVQRAAIDHSWTSSNTNRRRQILLVGFLGTAGIVAAALAFFFFSRWYIGRQPKQLASEPVVTATPESDASELKVELPSEPRSAPATEPTDPAPLIELTYPGEDAPADDTLAGGDNQALPESEPVELTVPSDESPTDTASASVEDAQVPVPPSQQQPNDKFAALPKQLQELYAVIAEPFALSMPQQVVVPDRPPVTAQELGLAGKNGDKALPPIDLAKVAGERWVRGLRLDAVSLPRAIGVLSTVTGVPTQVDLDSLAAVGLDRNTKLNMILEPGPAEKLAKQFAEKAGLEIHSIDNQYWRVQAASPDQQRLPLSIEIQDLVGPDQTEWLAEALGRLFPDHSASLQIDSGVLRWDNQKKGVATWFTVVRLLENWRRQKGLARRFLQYDDAQLRQELVTAGSVPGLQAKLKSTTSAPRALASFISQISVEAGINCWVDWPSLAQLGLSPNEGVLSVTRNRTLLEVLQELAFEYGLVTVIIDQQTLWLTDTSGYRRITHPLVLPSRGKAIDDYWSSWLRPLTGVDSTGVAQLPIEMTPDQQFVIVRCCWPTLQFSDQ